MILQTPLMKPQIWTTLIMRKLPTKHRNVIKIENHIALFYDDKDNYIKIEDIDNDNTSQAVVLEQNGHVKETTMATDDDNDKASFDSWNLKQGRLLTNGSWSVGVCWWAKLHNVLRAKCKLTLDHWGSKQLTLHIVLDSCNKSLGNCFHICGTQSKLTLWWWWGRTCAWRQRNRGGGYRTPVGKRWKTQKVP